MEAIKFPEANHLLRAPGCNDLPAWQDGNQTVACFRFSPEEIEKLKANGGVFFYTVLSGKAFYPMNITVDSPFFTIKSKDAFHEIFYLNSSNANDKKPGEWVYNNRNADAPKTLVIGGDLMLRDLTKIPAFKPNARLSSAGYQIDDTTPEILDAFSKKYAGMNYSTEMHLTVKLNIPGFDGTLPIFNH